MNDELVPAEFCGNDNYGNPRSEYLAKLKAMDDEALFAESKSKIWLAAYAHNNSRSDFHWHVSALYREFHSRGKDKEYSRAYDEVKMETTG